MKVTFPTRYSAAGTLLPSLAAESQVRHLSFGNDTACQSKGVANSYDAAMPASQSSSSL